MAIDTAQKRFSMLAFGMAWAGGRLPVPDGSNFDSPGQRQMPLGAYSGIDFGTGGLGTQVPAYRAGGFSFDADGRMITQFLLDAEPVPADAQFHNGVAYDKDSGGRFVCTWPVSDAVHYRDGAAVRSDGAMTILDGAPEIYHNIFGYTQRGELCITNSVPSTFIGGLGFSSDRLSVTEIN